MRWWLQSRGDSHTKAIISRLHLREGVAFLRGMEKPASVFPKYRFSQNNASGLDSEAPLRNSDMFSGGWKKCSPLDSCWRSRGIVRSNVWSELSAFVSDQFLRQSLLGFEAHHRFTALWSVFVQKKSFFWRFAGCRFLSDLPIIQQELQRHLWPQLISIGVILQQSDYGLIWH